MTGPGSGRLFPKRREAPASRRFPFYEHPMNFPSAGGSAWQAPRPRGRPIGKRSTEPVKFFPAKRTFFRLLAAGLLLGVFALFGWFALPFALPLPEALLRPQALPPVLLDRHGVVLRHVPALDGTRAEPVAFHNLPPDLVACTLAAEDKRFHRHSGIDLLATARAVRDGVRNAKFHSGASTITQQLIKISCPPARRGIPTKIREALGARRLEMAWTKEQILTAYLNRLDYGNQRTGLAEAARFYFQKPPADLSLAECALLAGLPQGPSRLNPLRHPHRAVKRRNIVLHRLATIGNIPQARIRAALAETHRFRPLRGRTSAPWLAGISLPEMPGEYRKIPTTLDASLQADVERIVSREVAKLRSANLRHAAVVVLHNPTREILALVSSANWHDPRGGQINGVLSPRSPGSTLKPFTYLLAFENNHRIPASIVADVPTPLRTPQGLGLPQNYDLRYRGPVSIRHALACSLNIPAMRELDALGGPQALHDLLVSFGITTLGTDPSEFGLGLTIGNAPVRLLELANAYATLADGGRIASPTLFPRTEATKTPSSISYPSLYLIADILSDPTARAPAFSHGGPLDLPFRCAVKTGTSSDFRDNWCIGYTPEFTVGVWAGNFEHQPMKQLSGISGAAPIFHDVMIRAHRKSPPRWFSRPPSVVSFTADIRTGKSLHAGAENTHAIKEIAPSGMLPPATVPADTDATGRVYLDETYAAWFHSPENKRHHELVLAPVDRAVREPLRVILPAPGTTLLLDPDIPSGADKLRPVTNLPGAARWSSTTLRIEPGTPEPIVHLAPGTHTLTATDSRTGETQEITLHVKSL